MVALCFIFYNFGRVHQTLRVTPAMEAGIADHVWSLEELVGLLDNPTPLDREAIVLRKLGALLVSVALWIAAEWFVSTFLYGRVGLALGLAMLLGVTAVVGMFFYLFRH